MASLGDIVIGLQMDTRQFSGAAQSTRGELGKIASVAGRVTSQIAGMLGVGSALEAIGFGIKLAADAEQTAVAFEVMLGSGEKAKQLLSELKYYSDHSPFSTSDVQQFAQMLANYGVAADRIMPTIRTLGDVAAGDRTKFEGLARAYGQISATGRLMGQDLNQLINAGFNPLQEISKKTGESMAELKKRMEDGRISSDEVTDAFKRATSEGGRFFGMTERQSNTLTGQWSTFKDTLDTTLRDIGASIATNLDLKGVLASTSQWLTTVGHLTKTYGGELTTLATILGSVVAGIVAVRTAAWAYSAVQSVLIAKEVALKAVMGPAGWLQLAAGVAAAGVAMHQLSSTFEGIEHQAMKTVESVKEIARQKDPLVEMAKTLRTINALQREGSLPKGRAAANANAAVDRSGFMNLAGNDLELLMAKLSALNDMQLLPAAKLKEMETAIRAAMAGAVNDASGLTAALAKQREEIEKLTMGEDAYQRQQLKRKGASDEGLKQLAQMKDEAEALKAIAREKEELARLQAGSDDQYALNKVFNSKAAKHFEELASLQRQTQALREKAEAEKELAAQEKHEQDQLKAKAEQVKESTMTPEEKRIAKRKELAKLLEKGLIDNPTYTKALADLDKDKSKSSPTSSKAALAGTSEAAQIMLAGVFGKDKQQIDLAKQQVAETKQVKGAIEKQKAVQINVVSL